MAGKVLIVDTKLSRRAELARTLHSGFLATDEIDDFDAVLCHAKTTSPYLILIDCAGEGNDGVAVCKALKADPDLQLLPIVLMVDGADHECRLAGLQAGADDLLVRPYDNRVLMARVRSLMRIKAMGDELSLRQATARELGLQQIADPEAELSGTLFTNDRQAHLPGAPKAEDLPGDCSAARILLIAPDKAQAQILEAAISTVVDAEITIATTGFAALRLTETQAIDAIVIAEAERDQIGFAEAEDPVQLIAAISSRADARHAPILFLAQGAEDTERLADALNSGAADCASLADPQEELAARLTAQLRRKRYSDHLRASLDDGLRLAVTDGLTGLPGRRYLNQHLERLFARARREGRPLSAFMIDLDRFKAINDRFGHDAGDAALVEFARRLKAEVRGGDLVARYGGEEFLVITTDATGSSAHAVAERVRSSVADMPVLLADGTQMVLTVSIGVASLHEQDTAPGDLITRADRALGKAKKGGRNRICVAAA